MPGRRRCRRRRQCGGRGAGLAPNRVPSPGLVEASCIMMMSVRGAELAPNQVPSPGLVA